MDLITQTALFLRGFIFVPELMGKKTSSNTAKSKTVKTKYFLSQETSIGFDENGINYLSQSKKAFLPWTTDFIPKIENIGDQNLPACNHR